MKPHLALCLGLLATACGEKAYSTGDGANTINGVARLAVASDQSRTCAGQAVELIPDSVAARERLGRLYGSTARGFLPADRAQPPSASRGAQDKVRRTLCDDQGAFTFDRVPDGVWYTLTSIDAPEGGTGNGGGSMMARVEVRGGVTRRVMLP